MNHLLGILLVLLCVAFETLGQLLYRAGSRARTHRHLIILGGVVLHILEMVSWLTVLRFLPLGVALPLMGANYATIALAGHWIFGERCDRRRWSGVALIVAGFVLVARSGL